MRMTWFRQTDHFVSFKKGKLKHILRWRSWKCVCLWQTEAGVASSDDGLY
jgi:hypothetical protein